MTTVTEPRAETGMRTEEAPLRWWPEPRVWVRAVSLAGVLGAWEALGWTGVIKPSTFSYPSAIVEAFLQLILSGEMLKAAYQSSQILGAGLAIAIPLGIVIGVLMGRSRPFEYAVDTFVYALYATPVVALAFPIAMVLGVDFVGKTTIVIFFAIMPVIINVYHGVRNVDPALLEVTRSFCSSEWQRWRDLIFPSVVPYLVAGLGMASGRALVGMVVAEFLMSISGLGALSQDYIGNLEMDKGLAPVVFLMIVGIILTRLVGFFESRFASWRTRSER